MAQDSRHGYWRLELVVCLVAGAIAACGDSLWGGSTLRASAQNVPLADNTPGRDLGTVVQLQGNTFAITGGTTAGSNLFHGFSSFSVPQGGTASFLNDPHRIANIFARVTGGISSNIQGVIQAQGNANLFLMNPSGIIFGPGARLNIGGSFVGTTANAIQFPGGGEFSVTSPVAANNPLLQVNPSALVFNQMANQPISPITVQNGANLSVGSQNNPQLLYLVGGDVSLDNGSLSAPSGRIELGGLAAAGVVTISPNDSGSTVPSSVGRFNPNDFSLIFPSGVALSNVSLANLSLVDTSSNPGIAGDIKFTGGSISVVNSQVTSKGNSDSKDHFGTIELLALQGSVTLDKSFYLSATNIGSGSAGNVGISARDQISISNSISDGNGIFSQGNSGFILIGKSTEFPNSLSPKTVNIDNAALVTNNSGSGLAGDISISAIDRVSILNGSKISSQEDFGRLFIGKSKYVSFSPGTVVIDSVSQSNPSTLSTSNSDNVGSGKVGYISIDSINDISIANSVISSRGKNDLHDLTSNSFGFIQIASEEGSLLLKHSILSTTNDGSGYAGDISITARNQVSILNTPPVQGSTQNTTKISSNGHLGRIFIGQSADYANFSPRTVTIDGAFLNTNNSDNTGSNRTGKINAGDISVRALDSVYLTNNARLNSSTYREGNAGSVWVQANGDVSLSNGSAIFSTAEKNAMGNAGGISIQAGSFSIKNGGGLTTETAGQGDAGLIQVAVAGDVFLLGNNAGRDQLQTGIFSSVNQGSNGAGGAIVISADRLFVRDGAVVSVDNGGGGEAGGIGVIARRVILDNRGILTARTASGNGGDIDLTEVSQYVVLSRNSNISTAAALDTGSGNGGNIDIHTLFVIGTPRNYSNVFATSFGEKGGFIRVRAIRLFDIARRPLNLATNNIDARALSKAGIDGTVDVNALDIDPSRALVKVPVIQLPDLLARGCRQNGGQIAKEEFVITGRGGLPANPSDTLGNTVALEDLGKKGSPPGTTGQTPAESQQETVASNQKHNSPSAIAQTLAREPIVQAQGWTREPNGDIILTAQTPTVIPQSSWTRPVSCHGS